MGVGMGVIKYLLFIFNVIFVLCGIAIMALGVVVQVGSKSYGKNIVDDLKFPAITLIVLGVVIFIIAFFGCCGAIRESHCMIVTYATLLLIILIIQVAVAIFTFFALKNSTDGNFENTYRNSFFLKYRPENAEEMEIVDNIQETLNCCGVTNAKDFSDELKIAIPGSCCNKPSTERCDYVTVMDKPGCAKVLEDIFRSSCGILGGLAMGIAAIELVGIIFALCLGNSIKNAERRGYSV